MRSLLRSTIVITTLDEQDKAHLLKNAKALMDSGIVFKEGMDEVWAFIKAFVREHKHVPSKPTLDMHFDYLGHEAAYAFLSTINPMDRALLPGDFDSRLHDMLLRQDKEKVASVLRDAASLTSEGAERAWRYLADRLDERAKGHKRKNRDYKNLDERYVFLEQRGDVYDRKVAKFFPISAVRMRGENERAWCDKGHDAKRPTAHNVTFVPGGAESVEGCLNIYDASQILQPRPMDHPDYSGENPGAGDFINLVWHLANGDQAQIDYLINWVKFALENPAARQCALVLKSDIKGAGKGTFLNFLRGLFGRYAATVGDSALSSNFNGWMLECVIACCDEVTESSMKDKRAIGNKLKTWVTESSLQIEAKGKDQITARNHSKWIYTTNDRVPIILEEGDRRYSVIQPETRTVDNPALDGVPARVEGFALDRSSTEAAEYFQSVADYLGLPCRVPYNPWVPLETAAKAELLADGRQGTESFCNHPLTAALTASPV